MRISRSFFSISHFKSITHKTKRLPGISPVPFPRNFWHFDRFDFLSVFLMSSVTIFFWIVNIQRRGSLAIVSYWDGPNYIYSALTLYKIRQNNPWSIYFRVPPTYFACHLPGFPFAIRLFRNFFRQDVVAGTHFAILVISGLLPYTFRRLLRIFEIGHDHVLNACMLSIFPVRLALYHSVAASEPLFLVFCWLAFIFFKTDRLIFLYFSIFGACWTRIEGLAVWGTIGLCYLFRVDFLGATVVGCALLAPISLALFHQWRFKDWKAYFTFNHGTVKLIRWPPFLLLTNTAFASPDLVDHQGSLVIFPVFLIGTALLFPVCVPFAIFTTVYLCYCSLLWHLDVYRYALPGYIFAVVIGFNDVWSSRGFKIMSIALVPLYFSLFMWYGIGQLESNCADEDFMNMVLPKI
jgi:hypothetical protein